MGKGNVFVVLIDFTNLHLTYNIYIIAELQREVTSIPLLTGLFTLRDRVSANEDEVCEIINAITILKTQNNDVNSEIMNCKIESPTPNLQMKLFLLIFLTLFYSQ